MGVVSVCGREQAVDIFPHKEHVETVALLIRNGSSGTAEIE